MKKLILFVLWVSHGLLYIFRDFIFVNINYEIKHIEASKGSRFELYNYTHSFIEQFVSGMNVTELNNAKWALTLIFSLFFCILTTLLLRVILKNWNDSIKYSMFFYGALLILGALLYFILGYSVSREVMIIPQSPIASIILFMAVKIFKKES